MANAVNECLNEITVDTEQPRWDEAGTAAYIAVEAA